MQNKIYSADEMFLYIANKMQEFADLQNRNRLLSASDMIERLQAQVRTSQPGNPAGFGWKSYSQNDEDGIIRYCLQKISSVCELTKTFIEIGAGSGIQNNSYQLLLDGYKGCWVDGDSANISKIKAHIPEKQKKIFASEAFITLRNLDELLDTYKAFLSVDNIDFFSLDVDGNDYYFLPICLEKLRPKLVCVEYNGKFPPPTVLYMKYNESHKWDRSDYQGVSLQAYVDAMPDYKLVSCSVVGINAFFVHRDFANLFENYTTEELYQPARMHLLGLPSGHPPAYSWLKQVLQNS